MLWAKIRLQKLKPKLFAELVDLIPCDEKKRRFIEFVIFVSIGTFIGIYVVSPATPQQAVAAGFAWTGLFSVKGG